MAKLGVILGSNLGDKLAHLDKARKSLEVHVGKVIGASSVYVTPPWGYDSTNDYYNQVLLLDTDLAPEHILSFCLRIETSLGRKRDGKDYQDRTIDIDLLYLDNEIIHQENLQIPHPRMHLRKFCLLPLFEVNPDWVHPEMHLDMISLIENCQDDADIKRLS